MPELQQPDIAGNFLSSYYTAQQKQQADADRQRNMMRQDQGDEMARQAHALKIGQEVVDMLGSVADGDTVGFERAKQRWGQMGLPPEAVAGFTAADLPMLRQKAGTQLRELQLKNAALAPQLTQAQIDAQRANINQSNAAAAASNRANRTPAGIDPNTGRREAPAGIQGKDYKVIEGYSANSDAAANIASVYSAAKSALDKNMTGPGAGLKRTAASVVGLLPNLGVEEFLTGENRTQNIIDTYDAVDQAAKMSGIEALKGIGGSDTERELLTAIQTGVNNDASPEENRRRVSNQLAAANILSKKAQLASEWVNRFGSLGYAAPDGTTWQKFWPSYQKQEWVAHRQREAQTEAVKAQKAKEEEKGGGLGGWTINLVTQ